ncbi:MAG: redoxin domain-containing protein [Humidesulfovibrio sp.]|nr:redoxin domain-containing protein [Humidesulfovibrio sp.]
MPNPHPSAPPLHRSAPPRLPALLTALALALGLALGPAPALGAGTGRAAAPAAAFPDLTLELSAQDAQALGLGAGGPTCLSRIPAQGLFVLLMSYFCPPCHKEVPRIKDLERRIRERGLAGRIRLIGLAPGDNQALVDNFKTRHGGLPFALVPDPVLSAHKRLGSPVVPTLYAIASGGGKLRLLSAHEGEFTQDPDAFLDAFLRALPAPHGSAMVPARK